MESKELRIGNWVTCYNHAFRIGVLEKTYAEDMDADEGGFAYEDIQGIPLTPEILLKAGGKERNGKHGCEYIIGRLRFTYEINEFGSFVRFHYSGKWAYLQYLHQLQNLYYAIKSHELTIIL